MLMVYSIIPNDKIKKDGKELVGRVNEFFETNKRRRICNLMAWYGKQIKVRKGHVQEDINAAVKAALKE